MQVTLNEYVHENCKITTNNGFVKVFYESLEQKPVESLNGIIYAENKFFQTFFIMEDGKVVINNPISNKKCHVTKGFFYPTEGLIIFIWNKYPGEHFLCVSYESSPDMKSDCETYWIEEGF